MSDSTSVEFLSIPMIRTRMAEDILPIDNHNVWMTRMGIVPGSEEGAAMERDAGAERRSNLRGILPSVDLFTAVASDLMQKAILIQSGKSVDDEFMVPIGSLALANLAVTRAVLVQMLDLGILKIRGVTVEGTLE